MLVLVEPLASLLPLCESTFNIINIHKCCLFGGERIIIHNMIWDIMFIIVQESGYDLVRKWLVYIYIMYFYENESLWFSKVSNGGKRFHDHKSHMRNYNHANHETSFYMGCEYDDKNESDKISEHIPHTHTYIHSFSFITIWFYVGQFWSIINGLYSEFL